MNVGLDLNVDMKDQEPVKLKLTEGGAALAPKTDISLAQLFESDFECRIAYRGEVNPLAVKYTRCRVPCGKQIFGKDEFCIT